MSRPPIHRAPSTITPPPLRGARTKEPAHLPLHRRLLFPTLPLEQPLPPIITASSKRPDVEQLNDRLYYLIALVLRAYVLSWYPRFSRDRTLLPTLSARVIVPLLSPILTGLHDDPDRIVQLILLDLPAILGLHCSTYWQARQALLSTPHLFPSLEETPHLKIGDIYHSRLPLLSVIPSPGINPPISPDTPYRNPIPPGQYTLSPLYLTSLTDALLRLHLPPGEYGCTVERVMAREIVGRVVLGATGTKLGEGWFWWSLALRFMGSASPSLKKEAKEGGERGLSYIIDTATRLCLRLYSVIVLLWTFTVSVSARYTAAPSTEERYRNCAQPWVALGREMVGVDGRMGISPKRWGVRLAWGLVEGAVTLLGPLIDRILPHLIRSKLTPALSLRLIDLLERILFPLDGYPGPSPPDLMPEEARATRAAFENRLKEIIPLPLQTVFLPDKQDIGTMLDPLDNPGCNAHLIAMILDSVVGALEPALVVPPPTNMDISDDKSGD